MLRVVLDANVVVSAFLQPKGPSGGILRHSLEKKNFELVLSEAILNEIRNTLRYPRVRRHLKLPDLEIEVRIASIGILADLVPGVVEVRAVQKDPDDDKYLGVALEGRAEYIISGDHHLRDLGEFQGIQILSPRQFVDVLKALPPTPGPIV
jgi:hypothetical protein